MPKISVGCLSQEEKKRLLPRIRRIQGQLEGIERMLQEDRYCIDILQQISAVFEALRGVSKEVLRYYLEVCVKEALLSSDPKKQEEIYRELIQVIYKYAR